MTEINPLKYFDQDGTLVEDPYIEVWTFCGDVDVCFNYKKFLNDLEKWNLENWFFKRG